MIWTDCFWRFAWGSDCARVFVVWRHARSESRFCSLQFRSVGLAWLASCSSSRVCVVIMRLKRWMDTENYFIECAIITRTYWVLPVLMSEYAVKEKVQMSCRSWRLGLIVLVDKFTFVHTISYKSWYRNVDVWDTWGMFQRSAVKRIDPWKSGVVYSSVVVRHEGHVVISLVASQCHSFGWNLGLCRIEPGCSYTHRSPVD